jgi:N-formylglutamate deformylase
MSLVFHIPHASKVIPKEYLKYFVLSPKELNEEILKMTDHYTDQLFEFDAITQKTLTFPVSRLLVDPERFISDSEEVMSKVGMGCIYERTHDGEALKNASKIRDGLINRYYQPHHESFTNMVDECLKLNSKCLIVDCHSFPKNPLPYELNQEPERAEICIGTDSFHTPQELTEYFVSAFSDFGFSVSVDTPFSGSIVPMKFYRKNKSVHSIMIEIRRDLYMDESTGEQNFRFADMRSKITEVLDNLGVSD